VHQQQEHLDTIENSVQATKIDTEKGKEDLESAQEYAKSGRKVCGFFDLWLAAELEFALSSMCATLLLIFLRSDSIPFSSSRISLLQFPHSLSCNAASLSPFSSFCAPSSFPFCNRRDCCRKHEEFEEFAKDRIVPNLWLVQLACFILWCFSCALSVASFPLHPLSILSMFGF
jgi:hypothetical protein